MQRDFRNRWLDKAGEELAVDLERKRLVHEDRDGLARTVRWVATEDGDGAGFDVLSSDARGKERLSVMFQCYARQWCRPQAHLDGYLKSRFRHTG